MLKQSLVENQSILLNQTAHSWQEAVKLAVDLLEKSGCVKPIYLDNIIKGIEQHGPYIVLAPGFAMPHARPEDGVIKTGFSLVTLTEPIYFDGEEEGVSMLIALAGSDANTHMEEVVEITQILDDEESETGVNIEKFLCCKTVDEVLTVIDTALEQAH